MINLKTLPIHSLENKDWAVHFRENGKHRLCIDFSEEPALSKEQKALVFPSIRLFQAGEASDGRYLLESVKKYVQKSGDDAYMEAMRAFVAEENCHSAYLRTYMEFYQIPVIPKSFLDKCFRRLRKSGGLKCEVTVLVTAEIIALSYYSALEKCTDSQALKQICGQMLQDELPHIAFQSHTLYLLKSSKPEQLLRILLMEITIGIVWLKLHPVFRRGGYSFRFFAGECLGYLKQSIRISKTGKL